MKFKIFMEDNHYWNESQMACALGLRRTANGRGWVGWVTKSDLDVLDKGDYRYKLLF